MVKKFLYFSGKPSNLVLSDSMFKNCMAKDTKWSCHLDCKIKEIMDKVKFTVSGYKVILIQAGTNDFADLVYKKGIETAIVQDVLKHYHALNEMIRRRNKHAFLLFCSILPRKTDYNLYFFSTDFWTQFLPSVMVCKIGGQAYFFSDSQTIA